MTRNIIAAFRDHEQKCFFVRYEGGVIDRKDLEDGDRWAWLGDHHNNPSPDPEGIVWAALTGQRSSEAKIGMESPPKRKPNIAKFYCDDEPLAATNCEGAIAKIKRLREIAKTLRGKCINMEHVRQLVDEIFAP